MRMAIELLSGWLLYALAVGVPLGYLYQGREHIWRPWITQTPRMKPILRRRCLMIPSLPT